MSLCFPFIPISHVLAPLRLAASVPYPILPYPTLPCPILRILSYSILSFPTLPYTPPRMRYITSISQRTKFNSAVLVTESIMGTLYLLTGVVGYAALGKGMDVHK